MRDENNLMLKCRKIAKRPHLSVDTAIYYTLNCYNHILEESPIRVHFRPNEVVQILPRTASSKNETEFLTS